MKYNDVYLIYCEAACCHCSEDGCLRAKHVSYHYLIHICVKAYAVTLCQQVHFLEFDGSGPHHGDQLDCWYLCSEQGNCCVSVPLCNIQLASGIYFEKSIIYSFRLHNF